MKLYRSLGVLLLLMILTSDVLATRRRGHRRRGSSSNQDLMHLLNQIQSQLDDGSDISFTPSPPSPEEVECYVTVQQTVHIGGRCVYLGSQFHPACQSGPHLDPFNHECHGRRPNNTNNNISTRQAGNSNGGG